MKKNIYKKQNKLASFALCLASVFTLHINAQSYVETFETFTLASNSAYTSTVSAPFAGNQASFPYKWDAAFGYWAAGFSYTNKYDSITAGSSNMFGVRPLKGNNASSIYVIGQDRGVVKMGIPQTTVSGFYITNSTYVYKSMAKGDAFAKKFGDTTGTGSGTTIAQGAYPDFFKVIVKGYSNGVLKNDSVTVMLADYTFTNNAQDFILSNWQFVNTSAMGAVDSVKFFMRSSDVGSFGINTPLFFAIDDFETVVPNPTGISKLTRDIKAEVYPNPFTNLITIHTNEAVVEASIKDISGKLIYHGSIQQEATIDLSFLQQGVYFLELTSNEGRSVKRLIKN